jgi:hypothetical protein
MILSLQDKLFSVGRLTLGLSLIVHFGLVTGLIIYFVGFEVMEYLMYYIWGLEIL